MTILLVRAWTSPRSATVILDRAGRLIRSDGDNGATVSQNLRPGRMRLAVRKPELISRLNDFHVPWRLS
jgi:hypothetical protein